MSRPTTPIPPPENWYEGNFPKQRAEDEIQKTCPACGRVFWTTPQHLRTAFPCVHESIYCSRICKVTTHNQRWYKRHKKGPFYEDLL